MPVTTPSPSPVVLAGGASAPPPAPSPPREGVGARGRAWASWKTEGLRAAAVVVFSAGLALATNGLSSYPVPLLAADGPGALPERAQRIGAEEYRKLLAAQKALLLLDVRSKEAWGESAGHAAGALHAPFDDFAAYYARLNLDSKLLEAEEVVLICESDDCLSADRTAKLLKDLHYPNVRVFYGGWNAYVEAGFQVEAGDANEKR